MSAKKLVIVGAGACGLMAARILSNEGMDVHVVEARDRIGGRIHSIPQAEGIIIEAGAEFVHGNLGLTLGLLNEFGIHYQPVSGSMYEAGTAGLSNQQTRTSGWNDLMDAMELLEIDIDLQSFLQKNFGSPAFKPLREQAERFASGFDLADCSKVSTKALWREWSESDHQQFRIEGGYGSLANQLQRDCVKKGCRFSVNKILKLVEWEPGKVRLLFSDGSELKADLLLITVPLTVLLAGPSRVSSISFRPAITQKLASANHIGMGNVIKIIFQFKSPFWSSVAADAGFFLSQEPVPTWWTQLPDQTARLTGWIGGNLADHLIERSDAEIEQQGIVSLSKIFDLSVEYLFSALEQAWIFNWCRDPFSLGGYSYATPATEEAIRELKVPVAETIFFAGEALYKGPAAATVEAALSSAQEVAYEILKQQ